MHGLLPSALSKLGGVTVLNCNPAPCTKNIHSHDFGTQIHKSFVLTDFPLISEHLICVVATTHASPFTPLCTPIPSLHKAIYLGADVWKSTQSRRWFGR